MTPDLTRLVWALALTSLSLPAHALPGPPHDFASGISCGDCHVPYGGLAGTTDSSATSGSTTGLTDGSMSWTAGEWQEGVVTFTSGPNLGQFRTVLSNTSNALTWGGPLPSAVGPGDTYSLGKTTDQDIETQCKTCHNPTGSASTMPDVGLHVVAGGTITIGCGDCHDPHDTDPNSGPGNGLIRESLRYGASTGTVLYPSGQANDFLGDTFDGVCEDCHTNTTYHRNDASGNHAHNSAQPCTNCHTHDSGFDASAACGSCHNTTQPPGGDYRRTVVGGGGDFVRTSHHVTDDTTSELVTDSDCVTCHDQSAHQSWPDPDVRLSDADLVGTSYTYDGTGASLEATCLSCHDADGSLQYGTQPFSDGHTPEDVEAGWTGSAHSGSPAVALSDEKCLACHGGADATNPGNVQRNVHGSANPKLLSGRIEGIVLSNVEEALCLRCHDGSVAAEDVEAQIVKGTNGSNIFHHPVVDAQQSPGRAVECIDCHDEHAARSADPLFGVAGIDRAGGAVGPGASVLESEVCTKCHGDTYNTGRSRSTNKRTDFAVDASSYHPVDQPGRNTSSNMAAQLLGGLTTASTMSCIDCHNSDQTGSVNGLASNSGFAPQGPHGSTNAYILRARYVADLPEPNWNASDYNLCFGCHDLGMTITNDRYGNGARTNFMDGNENLHEKHVVGEDSACFTCHYNTHGNNNAGTTDYVVNSTTYTLTTPPNVKTRNVSFAPFVGAGGGRPNPTFSINTSTRTRACYINCHGDNHNPENYRPDPGLGDDDPLTF